MFLLTHHGEIINQIFKILFFNQSFQSQAFLSKYILAINYLYRFLETKSKPQSFQNSQNHISHSEYSQDQTPHFSPSYSDQPEYYNFQTKSSAFQLNDSQGFGHISNKPFQAFCIEWLSFIRDQFRIHIPKGKAIPSLKNFS
jgi:hypothetical protein